ncbi:fibronectin type III domain-containing protein, partial [Candidatus Woesearchaeota archaeon]|nr:fibronectin type III domain-containing protein [Candidatus Woesearchaeota archaeon]
MVSFLMLASTAYAESVFPNVTFYFQSPATITSTNLLNGTGLNITYNVSDETALNLSTIFLFHKNNKTTSDVSYYLNGSAFSGWESVNYSSYSGESFLFRLYDNQVYPGKYNFPERSVETAVHSSVISLFNTDYFSIELLNVSSSAQYSFFEIMANNSGTRTIPLYYCNSSYSFTTNPSGSANCVNFYSIPGGKAYSHTHSSYSAHHEIPFALNATSGTIGTVKVSSRSYFMVRGNPPGVNVYGIPNVSRTDAMKLTTNNGAAWTNQAMTADAHLHQYDGTDKLWYYACANDTSDNENCSGIRSETLELTPLPPTVVVYTPAAQAYNDSVNISYSALSPNGYAISYYNISLMNIDGSFNSTILGNAGTATSYLWDASSVKFGNYTVRVQAVDSQGQSGYGFSAEFELSIGCGDTITSSVNLSQDLTECSGNGLIIGSNDVEVD